MMTRDRVLMCVGGGQCRLRWWDVHGSRGSWERLPLCWSSPLKCLGTGDVGIEVQYLGLGKGVTEMTKEFMAQLSRLGNR